MSDTYRNTKECFGNTARFSFCGLQDMMEACSFAKLKNPRPTMNANMLKSIMLKVQDAAPILKNGGTFQKKPEKNFHFGVNDTTKSRDSGKPKRW